MMMTTSQRTIIREGGAQKALRNLRNEEMLTALQQGLFEPLQTVEPKFQRKMKTLLLLALASIKRVGDLHAFRLTIRA